MMCRLRRPGAAAKKLLVCLLLVGCRESRENPETAPRPRPASPRLSIEPRRHDFGAVVQGAVLRRAFTLDNVGTSRLEIRGAGPVLGCSGQAEPSVLPPGGRAEFALTCTTEIHGPLRISLPVRSNDAATNEIEIVAQVTPLLSFDTPLVEMNLAYGEERSLEVRLTGALADQAQLQLKDAGTCGFDVRLVAAAPGQARAVHIVLKRPRVGVHVGDLLFTTGLDRPRELALPYSCKIAGTLSVSPTNPYFNLRLPGPKTQLLEVKSREPNFTIQSVDILDGPFAATFERAAAEGAYRVTVRVLEERLNETRGVVGTLRIRSNDRSELVKDVPLFALGRLNPAD